MVSRRAFLKAVGADGAALSLPLAADPGVVAGASTVTNGAPVPAYLPSAIHDVETTDVEYLTTGGQTLQARIYQPVGAGPVSVAHRRPGVGRLLSGGIEFDRLLSFAQQAIDLHPPPAHLFEVSLVLTIQPGDLAFKGSDPMFEVMNATQKTL